MTARASVPHRNGPELPSKNPSTQVEEESSDCDNSESRVAAINGLGSEVREDMMSGGPS